LDQENMRNREFYWKLFKSTFLISTFTVGGGYVIVPLLKAKFVDEYHWLDDKETLTLVSVAQSAPGVVAVNAAIIMGYKMAGLKGAFCATFATVLPPLITLTIISYFYSFFASNQYMQIVLKGMQCGATALIIQVMYDLLKKQWSKKVAFPIIITLGTFIANYFFNFNMMYIVLVDALIGLVLLQGKKYE